MQTKDLAFGGRILKQNLSFSVLEKHVKLILIAILKQALNYGKFWITVDNFCQPSFIVSEC